MKKKIILFVMSVIAAALLSGCGGPNGKYVSSNGLSSITFDGGNVEMSSMGLNLSGTYKISGSKLTVTVSVLGNDMTYDYSFSDNGDGSITIDGEKYIKS